MAESSEGYEGGPFMAESGWATAWGAAMTSGVIPSSGTALQVYSDEDGRQVKVRVGRGVMRGHPYTNDAIKTIALQPNTSGSDRYDTIVLRLDTVGKKVSAEPLIGSPSGTPMRANLTQIPDGVWEVTLGSFLAPANYTSIAASSVLDDRTWATPREQVGRIQLWGATTLPYNEMFCLGQSLRRDQYQELFAWYGTAWGAADAFHFNMPDQRNNVLMGADGNVGTYGGTNDFTLSVSQLPPHRSGMDGDTGDRWIVTSGSPGFYIPSTTSSGAQGVGVNGPDDVGGGAPVNWRPPNTRLQWTMRVR